MVSMPILKNLSHQIRTDFAKALIEYYNLEDDMDKAYYIVDTFIRTYGRIGEDVIVCEEKFAQRLFRYISYEDFIDNEFYPMLTMQFVNMLIFKGVCNTSDEACAISEKWLNKGLFSYAMEYNSIKNIKRYRWFAQSSDGAFEDESVKSFNTEKECYNNMREHALQKMTWNTEFDEDFEEYEDGSYSAVSYSVKFAPHIITLDVYDCLYTYQMEEC